MCFQQHQHTGRRPVEVPVGLDVEFTCTGGQAQGKLLFTACITSPHMQQETHIQCWLEAIILARASLTIPRQHRLHEGKHTRTGGWRLGDHNTGGVRSSQAKIDFWGPAISMSSQQRIHWTRRELWCVAHHSHLKINMQRSVPLHGMLTGRAAA